jgi:hypothetical protein
MLLRYGVPFTLCLSVVAARYVLGLFHLVGS